MATPIAPTPILRGKSARDFEKKIEEGLRNPVGLLPTPSLEDALEEIKHKIGGNICPNISQNRG